MDFIDNATTQRQRGENSERHIFRVDKHIRYECKNQGYATSNLNSQRKQNNFLLTRPFTNYTV